MLEGSSLQESVFINANLTVAMASGSGELPATENGTQGQHERHWRSRLSSKRPGATATAS